MNKTSDISDPRFSNPLLDAIPDGVFTLNNRGEITSWNPAMEALTGYTDEEVMGKNCFLIGFDNCSGDGCPPSFGECGLLKHGKVTSKECLIRHKNGFDIPVLKNARLVNDEHGSLLGIVETITDLSELKTIRQKMEEAALRLGDMHRLDNIIGKSHAMQNVFSSIRMAAKSDATVLIQGESGSGKELVAGAIHFNSSRADMPLVTVNCSALSESLLESELFGHVKGAFTGAFRDRIGRFEEAEGGTIFLDEIGEISPYIQIKLLRVLQEREVERVGDNQTRKINIRIIAATNKDLYELVRDGRFRQDLFYRLKVFPVIIPPLSERKEDIPLLADHFINIHNRKTGKKISGISLSAMRLIMDYDWPGNVRELENAIEHAFVLCANDTIDAFDLPLDIRQKEYDPYSDKTPHKAQKASSKQIKHSRESLIELLDECDWNKAEAGRRAGVSRTSIWKYMKKFKIPLNG